MLTLSVLSPWYLPRMGLRLVVCVGLLLISAGFLWMRVLQIDSPYREMMWPLLVMSTGIGFCTAPSTLAIMTAVPDEKQVYPRGAICRRPHTASDSLPRSAARAGLPFAGSGLGDLQNAWPARGTTCRTQPNRIPAGDGIVAAGPGTDHCRRRTGDRRLGTGPRRPAAATGPTNHVPAEVSRRTPPPGGRASRCWRAGRGW